MLHIFLHDLIGLQISLEIFPLAFESLYLSLLYLVLTDQFLQLLPLFILHPDELVITVHIDHHIDKVLIVHLHCLIICRYINILLVVATSGLLAHPVRLTRLVCHIHLDLVRLILDNIDLEHLLLLKSLVELLEFLLTFIAWLFDTVEVVEELLDNFEL